MSIKRTIITTIAVLALVATVAPMTASADTLSDLMNQIATLQAQLQTLQGGTTTASGTGACAGVTFTRNLTVGSTGTDVKCLQQILGVSPMSGYFGPITLAAVRAYQVNKGFVPANQVGPLTRAALNTSLATSTGTTGTTGTLCPNGNTLASSCTLAPNATGTPTLCPNGNTLASNCSLAPSAQATTGLVGFISVATLASSPADNANVTTTSNVPVLGLNVKAINSNMDVNSAKIVLYTTKSAAAEHPATSITNLYVYDGSTLLGTFPVNTSTVIKESSTYYMILSGFHFNVPANTTKVLTISADFVPGLETDRVLEIAMYDTTAIGATDGSGVNRTSGLTPTMTTGNPSTNQRTYTINYDVVGTSTLVATTDTTALVSSSINVNHTDGKTGVPMFIFSAKSTVGASQITDLVITAQGSDAGVAKTSSVSLYDGTTLLGSKSLSSAVSGATATFTDLAIDVAKDATKTLTVKADFAADVTSNGDDYVRLVILDPATDVTFNKPNLAVGHPTATTAVEGNHMYLYDNVVTTISLVSAASAYTYNSTTTSSSYTSGTITLKVHSDGGTTTEPVAADFTVLTYVDGTAQGAAPTKAITVTPDSTITDGNDATVVINVSVPRGGTAVSSGVSSGVGYVDFRVTNAKWVITDGTYTSTETAQTWGLTTFKTPAANAQ